MIGNVSSEPWNKVFQKKRGGFKKLITKDKLNTKQSKQTQNKATQHMKAGQQQRIRASHPHAVMYHGIEFPRAFYTPCCPHQGNQEPVRWPNECLPTPDILAVFPQPLTPWTWFTGLWSVAWGSFWVTLSDTGEWLTQHYMDKDFQQSPKRRADLILPP